eukprot:g28340.t1
MRVQEDEDFDEWLAKLNNVLADCFLPISEILALMVSSPAEQIEEPGELCRRWQIPRDLGESLLSFVADKSQRPDQVQSLWTQQGNCCKELEPWKALDAQTRLLLTSASFRKVARVEHPDVSEREDAEERFRRISLAYELLIDDGGRAMLLEALERDADDLEDAVMKKNKVDEVNEAWDEEWVEDEFTAVSRTTFLILMFGGVGSVIWWFGFDHE